MISSQLAQWLRQNWLLCDAVHGKTSGFHGNQPIHVLTASAKSSLVEGNIMWDTLTVYMAYIIWMRVANRSMMGKEGISKHSIFQQGKMKLTVITCH